MPNIDTITNSTRTQLYNATITGTGGTDPGTLIYSTALDSADGSAMEFIIVVGDASGALGDSKKLQFTVQDSADNTTWADVTDGARLVLGENVSAPDATTGVIATADDQSGDDRNDNRTLGVAYVGPSRYARVKINHIGNFTGEQFPVAVIGRLDSVRKAGDS